MARTLHAALPLFAFNALWLVYLTANRWIASALSDAVEFGLFAFGSNLVSVGIGVFGAIVQVHYPKHLAGKGEDGAQGRLGQELRCLVGVTAAGTAAGVLLCFYGVPAIFPHFAAAAAPSAALMASGIPLGLAAWLMPLVLAGSGRPWSDAVMMFAASFAALGVSMVGGDAVAGIVGQSWGCALAAMVLVALQLRLLARSTMLQPPQALGLLALVTAGMALDGLAWVLLYLGMTVL